MTAAPGRRPISYALALAAMLSLSLLCSAMARADEIYPELA